MANTTMMFPNTVREFMEQFKMVDTEQIYSNGIEYVPIFRMEQWFAHQADIPRWIPVAERRPEAYGRYLVTLEYEGYRSVMPLYYGRINRIDTFYDSDSEYGDIEYCGAIAWMPLPEPYKEGEQNDSL